MSRIVVIGGSGHVGSYLVPRLVELGHEVVNVSRGMAVPYLAHFAWNSIENIAIDRTAEEKAGRFGTMIAELRPEIVIDMISFDLPSAQQLVEALRGRIEHYLFCSSIWVYGRFLTIPSTEADPPNPIDTYGANKAAIEAWLLQQARLTGFPATCFRPGHIVGEGWNPINPLGNANPAVFSLIARGDEWFCRISGSRRCITFMPMTSPSGSSARSNRAASIGEAFNTVSEQAVTLRGYAETVYRWFGKEPRIAFKPFDEWIRDLEGDDAVGSRGHVIRSSCHSIEKSRQRLGYKPRYTSFEAIQESVRALIAAGKVAVPGAGLAEKGR